MDSLDHLRGLKARFAGAEAELAALFDASDDLVCLIGADGRFHRLNPAWERRLGYCHDEMVGRPLVELIRPEDATATKAVLESMDRDAEVQFENQLRHKDGSPRRLSWTASRWNADGLIYAVAREIHGSQTATVTPSGRTTFVEMLESILLTFTENLDADTTRRLAQQSAMIYCSVVETSPDAITITGMNGEVLMCNHQGAAIHGFANVQEMIGRNAFDYIAPEERERAAENARKTLELGSVRDIDYTLLRKDGSCFPVELSASVIRDAEGEPRAFIDVVRDITARKRAEEALRQSEERYRALYQDNPTMYFTVDAEGTVLSVNQFGAEQLGYSVEELVGRSVLNVFYEDDKQDVTIQLAACLRTPGRVAHWEFRKARKDGEIIWVKEAARATRDADGKPVVMVVCEDITDRKQMEEELQRVREELEGKVERQMARKDTYGLTFRELTILHLVAAGNADKEIGTTLGISPLTVSKHVANIMAKMGAASRSEATARAVREALVE